MISSILSIDLFILTAGSYLVWRSRWNIPAHFLSASWLVGALIPLLGTDLLNGYDQELVIFYTEILSLGAFSYLMGLMIGFNTKSLKVFRLDYSFLKFNVTNTVKVTSNRSFPLMILGVVGTVASFVGMGFIPIIADDPFAAKFFRGPYQELYTNWAPLFRFSTVVSQILVPISLGLWFDTKKKKFLVLALMTMLLAAAALSRANVLYGLLLFLGVYVAKQKKYFVVYMLGVYLLISLGSAIYAVFSYIIQTSLFGNYGNSSILEIIASGSPDVSDQLQFLSAFNQHGDFTYGRTFLGGLVPYNFYWNPSVWTLSILNDTFDVSEISSGGLRLPVAVWGYTAFGWLGVVFVSFMSGFFLGNATRFFKAYIVSASLTQSTLALMLYITLGLQFANFYTISFYSLLQVCTILFVALPLIQARQLEG